MATRVHGCNGMRKHGNIGAVSLQQRSPWIKGQASAEQETVAFMKVVSPLTSTEPSARARVVNDSGDMLTILCPHIVFAGALVQIRIERKMVFGKARRCTAKGSEYEIEVEKQEIY